jgi:hypothetical protein
MPKTCSRYDAAISTIPTSGSEPLQCPKLRDSVAAVVLDRNTAGSPRALLVAIKEWVSSSIQEILPVLPVQLCGIRWKILTGVQFQ